MEEVTSTDDSTPTESKTDLPTAARSTTIESTTNGITTAGSTTIESTTVDFTTIESTTVDSTTVKSTEDDSTIQDSTTGEFTIGETVSATTMTEVTGTEGSTTIESTTDLSTRAGYTTIESTTVDSIIGDLTTGESTTGKTVSATTMAGVTATDDSTPTESKTDLPTVARSTTIESTTDGITTAEFTTIESTTFDSIIEGSTTMTEIKVTQDSTTIESSAGGSTKAESTSDTSTSGATTTFESTTGESIIEDSTTMTVTEDSQTIVSNTDLYTTAGSTSIESTTVDYTTIESTTLDSKTVESTADDSNIQHSTFTTGETASATTMTAVPITEGSTTIESTTDFSTTSGSTTIESTTVDSITEDSTTGESTTGETVSAITMTEVTGTSAESTTNGSVTVGFTTVESIPKELTTSDIGTDDDSPIITCPDNQVYQLQVGENTIAVNWTSATATNNLGQKIADVEMISSLEPGNYEIGTYQLAFQATDNINNLTAMCTTLIVVEDSVCRNGFRRCPVSNGECIPEDYFCDKEMDCPNWSDENQLSCPCNDFEMRCNNTFCINIDKFCNELPFECTSNFDEESPLCDGSCLSPEILQNGRQTNPEVQRRKYLEGQTISFVCNDGYTLIGNNTLICQGGTFQGTPPYCYVQCPKPGSFENGEWSGTNLVDHGNTVSVSCNEGYELYPLEPTTYTCSDGQFVGELGKRCIDIKECSTGQHNCDSNADCSNTIGSFTCTCRQPTYEGNGTVCTDFDECEAQTSTCSNNATCNNTDGSFTCACNEGFDGDGFFCREEIYFLFGQSVGDYSLRENYRQSFEELLSYDFKPLTGFPYGHEFLQYVYFTENGLFVLHGDNEEVLGYPNPPSNGFETGDTRNLFAPFFADGDLSSDIGDVYYQEYTSDDLIGQTFLAEANDRLFTIHRGSIPSGFSPSWALKVTWYEIPQRPADPTVNRRNTFQSTLLTDGIYSFALSFYEEQSMLWDPSLEDPQNAILGYNIADFETVNLQLQEPLVNNRYRPDSVLGNTDLLGQWTFRFEENTDATINPKQRCIDWYNQDKLSSFNPSGLGTCPCGLLQVLRDARYRIKTQITLALNPIAALSILENEGISSDLFSTIVTLLNNADNYAICFQSSTFNIFLAGTECCYRLEGGSLIEGYIGLGSSSFSFLYGYVFGPWFILDQYVQHIYSDIVPQYYCCYDSDSVDMCNLYYERRPPANCRLYSPPAFSWMIGDPHIVTLDGYEYTFNGKGEYMCSDVNNGMFQLQCRMTSPISDPGTEATIFSAFVGRHTGDSETYVQFTLYDNGTDVSILINGTEMIRVDDLREGSYSSMTDPGFSLILQEPSNITSGNERVYASWSTGVAFGVSVTEQMLDVTVEFAKKYQGKTNGLFGIWNGNISDDLCSESNVCLNTTAELAGDEIFDVGNTWRLTENQSAFVYGTASYSDINDEDFRPKFLNELVATADLALLAQANSVCGDNEQCLFDILATGNVNIGESTKATDDANTIDKETLDNIPPVIHGIIDKSPESVLTDGNKLYVRVNQSVILQVNASDENPDDILTYSIDTEIDGSTIDSETGLFTWTPNSTDLVNLAFDVNDKSQTTTLFMEVRICACVNGGECDFESLVEGSDIPNNRFAVVQCICPPAWTSFDCSEDYDACMENPCHTGVSCRDHIAPEVNATCGNCPTGLLGNGFKCYDYDECSNGLDQVEGVPFCEHTELCVNTLGSYECSCRSGYDLHPNGKECIDIDECDRQTHTCDSNAECINDIGSYNCTCNEGYDGDGFECTDINECQTLANPCNINADCINTDGSVHCVCKDGYNGNGFDCDDLDECRQETSTCDENADCRNTIGSYICSCTEGFEGNSTDCFDIDECVERPLDCHPTSNCTNTFGSYTCVCSTGHRGDGSSCVDIDECAEDPDICKELEECVNIDSSYLCRCIPGYARETDEAECTNVNECVPVNGTTPCSELAVCTDTIGSYTCNCLDGYTGSGFLCNDIDECSLKTDGCEQDCVNTIGSYNCTCADSFSLADDQRTCTPLAGMTCSGSNPCDESASCILDSDSNPSCYCKGGYQLISGNTACADINECTNGDSNCDNTIGECTNTNGSYTCDCPSGYELQNDLRTCQDIDECLNNSICITNSECVNQPGSFNCTCLDGYEGPQCSNIDECESDLHDCTGNSECQDQEGSYVCVCRSGYAGNGITCIDENECLMMDVCHSLASCNNTIGSYQCICVDGYSGDGINACTNNDECSNFNNLCHAFANCTDTVGSYMCTCIEGYRGDGFDTCENIDECIDQSDICNTDATCTDTEGSYTCACNEGFEGNGFICNDIDECVRTTDNCDVNARCNNTIGSYTCFCNIGYVSPEGQNARQGYCNDYDECAFLIDDCHESAQCSNTIGSYSCACKSGFTGNGYECDDIDECQAIDYPCDSDGNERCVNTQGSYYCTCQISYFNISGQCIEAVSKSLMVEFMYIKGWSVEMLYNLFNFDEIAVTLAEDMDALFRMSIFADQYFGAETTGFYNVTGGLGVSFIINFDKELNVTDEQVLQAFLDGLAGRDMDFLEPDSQLLRSNVEVMELETDPCFAGTDDCGERNFQECVYLGNEQYNCQTCFDGFSLNSTGNMCVDDDECVVNQCPQGSICENTIGSYTCNCTDPGYILVDNVCVDDDECQFESCSTNEDCTNVPGSYYCQCSNGYISVNSECVDDDECARANDCSPRFECRNTDGSYECVCPGGFVKQEGQCVDDNECSRDVCPADAICSNTEGSYSCQCQTEGYEVSDGACVDRNECLLDDPCNDLENCSNSEGSYMCNCKNGYERVSNVCRDVDECSTNPCETNEVCINRDGSYECVCESGYVSNSGVCVDNDECMETSNICGSKGICQNREGGYTCDCNDGYVRENDACLDVDECSENPCGANKVCVNTEGSFSCDCDVGFVLVDDACVVGTSFRGEIRVVEVNESITLAAWDNDLSIRSSNKFQLYARQMRTIINDIYSNVLSTKTTFYTTTILGFKEGSIIVVYQLDFFTSTTQDGDDLLQLLRGEADREDRLFSVDNDLSVTLDLDYDYVPEVLPITCAEDYCTNNGVCEIDDLLDRVCSCWEGFTGDRCTVDERSNDRVMIIVIIICCTFIGILLFVLLGLCIVIFMRRRKTMVLAHRKSLASGIVVHNPAAQLRGLSSTYYDSVSVSSSVGGEESRMDNLAKVIRNTNYLNEQLRSSTFYLPESDDSEFIRPYVATGQEAGNRETRTRSSRGNGQNEHINNWSRSLANMDYSTY